MLSGYTAINPHPDAKATRVPRVIAASCLSLAVVAVIARSLHLGTDHDGAVELAAMATVELAATTDDSTDDSASGSSSPFPAQIFKRTHATRHAIANGEFVSTALGNAMSLSGNYTYSCINNTQLENAAAKSAGNPDTGPSACANRMLFLATGGFSMHYFQSYITPNGNITVEEWTDAWDDMHAFSDKDWTWDEFMPLSTTFYTDMLRPYLEWWSQNDIPLLLRSYEHGGEVYYSARFSIPKLGHIIEVVSGNVTGDEWRNQFKQYRADECEMASVLPRSHADYRNELDQYPPTGMLPTLLIAMVSSPASDVRLFPNFITNVTGLSSDHVSVVNESGCEYSDTSMLLGGSYMVAVRMVNNPRAKRTPSRTVALYEEDYTNTLDQNMNKGGYNGYGRYVDWHIGVYTLQRTLDTVGKMLDERGIGYKQGGSNATAGVFSGSGGSTNAPVGAPTQSPTPAGTSTGVTGVSSNATGSVWSRGISGLGVEFQSTYSGEYFDMAEVRVLDYCSPGASEPYGQEGPFMDDEVAYCPSHWAENADDLL